MVVAPSVHVRRRGKSRGKNEVAAVLLSDEKQKDRGKNVC